MGSGAIASSTASFATTSAVRQLGVSAYSTLKMASFTAWWFSDATEAADIVPLADLLLRLPDQVGAAHVSTEDKKDSSRRSMLGISQVYQRSIAMYSKPLASLRSAP
jgi:hypothetical protein